MPERPPGLYVEENFADSAARTTTGNSSEFTGYQVAATLRAQLDVTAASGTTPTLNVVLQDSVDGLNWNDVLTFAAKTAAGREVLNLTTPFADRLRARWSIAGTTPSFTFSIRVVSQGANV